jgi:hypothetical protein
MEKFMKHLKTVDILFYALLFILCAALLAGNALAEGEGIISLGVEGYENLQYGDTLPDGRIVLCGSQPAPDGYDSIVPWLLCLNADGTKSWEYLDFNHGRSGFSFAVSQGDGSIGTVISRKADDGSAEYILQFFTPYGELFREESLFPGDDESKIRFATKSRLLYSIRTADQSWGFYLLDWDWNMIAHVEGIDFTAYGNMTENDGTLLMTGIAAVDDIRKKVVIRKTDLGGTALWEDEFRRVYPYTNIAFSEHVLKAADDVYLAMQSEIVSRTYDRKTKYRNVLVKADSDVGFFWSSDAGLEECYGKCLGFSETGGKYAALFLASGDGNIIHKMRDQRAVCWFDENGTPLGTAELKMNPEDFPEMVKTLQADTEGKKLVPLVLENRMIPMQDGLWLLAKVGFAVDGVPDTDRFDTVLIKIPEP